MATASETLHEAGLISPIDFQGFLRIRSEIQRISTRMGTSLGRKR